jgi:hypothetical protein
VQLLKRWRDLAFAEECLAPISVVLTTLAGMHYAGEESVSEALTTILAGIVNAIALADLQGKRIVVRNPSNLLEDCPHRSSAIPGDSEPFCILTTDGRNLVLTQATVDETTMPSFVCRSV